MAPQGKQISLSVRGGVDLQDAFCHFGVHPDELRHCISPGLESGTGILWVAMLFGFKAAPLVMGRLSAAVEWLVQSLFHPASGQVQVCIDDVEPGTAQPAVSKGAVRLGSVWSLSCPSQRRAGQIRDLDWHNVRAPST